MSCWKEKGSEPSEDEQHARTSDRAGKARGYSLSGVLHRVSGIEGPWERQVPRERGSGTRAQGQRNGHLRNLLPAGPCRPSLLTLGQRKITGSSGTLFGCLAKRNILNCTISTTRLSWYLLCGHCCVPRITLDFRDPSLGCSLPAKSGWFHWEIPESFPSQASFVKHGLCTGTRLRTFT